ncbi:MAG: hypothetical protein KJ667_03085, partial [Alphaproteobacteria bacterium]|nr:hypothetical protein [Alphaproteobacteria bacterium]
KNIMANYGSPKSKTKNRHRKIPKMNNQEPSNNKNSDKLPEESIVEFLTNVPVGSGLATAACGTFYLQHALRSADIFLPSALEQVLIYTLVPTMLASPFINAALTVPAVIHTLSKNRSPLSKIFSSAAAVSGNTGFFAPWLMLPDIATAMNVGLTAAGITGALNITAHIINQHHKKNSGTPGGGKPPEHNRL